MRRSTAALGSTLFFAVAPSMVAGVIPWWITRWRVLHPLPLRYAAWIPIAAGAAILIHSFARFVMEGAGTPAPIAPTERLVVGGLYRHVRNPMYVGVLAAILGQAYLFGDPRLIIYGAAIGAAFVLFVAFYEEPTLRARYGEEYEAYRRAVPGWFPRLRPWRPEK